MMKNLLIGLMLTLGCSSALANTIQPFVADSMAEIESRYGDSPYIVALWSLSCPPCMHELAMLGEWQKAHPSIPLVLISTDGPEDGPAMEQALIKFDLTNADNWHYADTHVEKLRFKIDPAWRGELPRSYLYSPTMERAAVSGMLTKETLNTWQRQHAE